MEKNKFLLLVLSAFLLSGVKNGQADSATYINKSMASQSPVYDCKGEHSSCKTVYETKVLKEQIGKKIAIRNIYLIPTYQMVSNQRDFRETSFIYVELQSIWPQPFLLTASKISVVPPSNFIHINAEMLGGSTLASQITKNSNPSQFLFQPGEIKLIGLSQGIKLDGVLDFFKGEILNDPIFENVAPALNPNLNRVTQLNHFLQTHFGQKTFIRISFFEKDYQPVLTTNLKLGEGGNLFSQGEVSTSSYQLKQDAFIGEVLYQLRGGEADFEDRRKRLINLKKSE